MQNLLVGIPDFKAIAQLMKNRAGFYPWLTEGSWL
ncbi:hypothetical protein J2Z66_004386 [Paenibacillus eucommiae]|uniref:Uncharacterized protein n=1 Tax=Paenibacillus eucommiae TaxID=1355755 RepID=A0ABS4IZ10_9BACL|nr:hypothetical protein [Paenibacillus eucommiae]